MKRFLILAGLLGVLGVLFFKSRNPQTLITGRAMGCEWKFLTNQSIDEVEIRNVMVRTIEHWEQVLSTWRPDSDLSRYNRGEAASDDLKKVIAMAEQLHKDSDGAFDHRLLAALTKAGFGPGGSGMDLSSLGKGYAVDRVCEELHLRGIHRYVFSIAGEVRAGEGTWPVELEVPDPSAKQPRRTIELSGQALATSGNYRQRNREEGGKLASHIIDPRTGNPVMRPPCSVTVIGPSAALASGWATALFVLGPDNKQVMPPADYEVIWQH
ncbi:MAG: FAD:protein FMN transferase [Akkermansiaceae bacterium]|jgi:thiamine biosynthesis lipoprotein|nr:FAD:protein FMN transferase [Akkermansiaceae bacterium]